MTVVGTNQIKNNANGVGQFKLSWGGYGYARYGMSYYGQGGGITNQSKSPRGITTTVIGSPIGLLLSLTYATIITTGSGVTNQSKS